MNVDGCLKMIKILVIFFTFFIGKSLGLDLLCNEESLKYTKSSCDVLDTKFQGDESVNITNYVKSMVTFFVSQSELQFIFKGFFKSYPNFKEFIIMNSKLQDLRVGDFENAGQLQNIILQSVNVTILRNSLFVGSPNLLRMRIIKSSMNKIEVECFKGLYKLTELYLIEGLLEQLENETLNDLINLEIFDVSNNFLTSLPLKIFEKNPKLKSIIVINNRLKSLPSEIFDNIKNLISLIASYNQLEKLELKNVMGITAENNKISSYFIPESLVSLTLANNSLEKLTCANTLNVTGFYGQDNNLKNMKCIRKMTKLVNLDLSNNKLTKLSRKSFAQLNKIWYFHIHGNRIKNPFPIVFFGMKEVFRIKIDRMQNYKNLRKNFPKLYAVNLQTKDWNCTRIGNVAKILKQQKIGMGSIERFDSNQKNLKCRIPVEEFMKN